MAASTASTVLSKLGKLLRFARKLKASDVVPNIERLPLPRKRPMAVLVAGAVVGCASARVHRAQERHPARYSGRRCSALAHCRASS